MKTLTINLYSFNELSKEAQINALDAHRYINVEHNWDDYIIEDSVEKLNEIGFKNAKIQYTGFSSQGDGLSFDADIDISKLTDNQRIINLVDNGHIDIEIIKTYYANHYNHERTRYVSCEYNHTQRDVYPRIETFFDSLTADIENKRLVLCQEIYKRLESTYENLISDEQIKETFEANEYTFEEDGTMRNF